MNITLSYSGLSKMLFSPKLYYKHYILGEREESIDSWAVDGSIVDAYLTDQKIEDKFAIVPGVIPTESTKKLVYRIYKQRDGEHVSNDLSAYSEDILNILSEINLHQALKTDAQRLDKILTDDAKNYFKFLCESEGKIVIDTETLERNKARADMVKADAFAADRLQLGGSDFNFEVITQKMLKVDLKKYPGISLRGIPDRIVIDNKNKIVRIIDIKTSSKSLNDFYPDTYNFYNYGLQSAIYIVLVMGDPAMEEYRSYKLEFEFFLIDKYDDFCFFPVSTALMTHNHDELEKAIQIAKYHIENEDYNRPYKFRNGIFVLS
jgi:hypothetical protein